MDFDFNQIVSDIEGFAGGAEGAMQDLMKYDWSPESMLVTNYMELVRSQNCLIKKKDFMKKIIRDKKLGLVMDTYSDLKANCTSIEAVQKLCAELFVWTSDSFGGIDDWSPDIFKICYDLVRYKKVKDDCDGAARLAHYLFRFYEENTKKQVLCAEVAIVPKPILKNLNGSHVVLYVKGVENEYPSFIIDNGSTKVMELGPYVQDYCALKGVKSAVVKTIPISNMDSYLSVRYTGHLL